MKSSTFVFVILCLLFQFITVTNAYYIPSGDYYLIYKGGYVDNDSRTWYATTDENAMLRFSCRTFDTENGYDELKVYPGTSTYDTPLAEFSGSDIPTPLIHNGMILYFSVVLLFSFCF